MTLVPADGLLLNRGKAATAKDYYTQMQGDPFPGTSEKHELNRTMNLPNFKWYTGKSNDYSISQAFKNIKEKNGVITFDFIKDFTTDIKSPNNINNTFTDGKIYTIDGRYMGTNKAILPHGLYIMNGQKFVIQ